MKLSNRLLQIWCSLSKFHVITKLFDLVLLILNFSYPDLTFLSIELNQMRKMNKQSIGRVERFEVIERNLSLLVVEDA